MSNIRFRLNLMALVNLLLLGSFLIFFDMAYPDQKTAIASSVGLKVLLAMFFLINLETIIANYYYRKIVYLFGKGLDDKMKTSLRDASISHLRKVSKKAVEEIANIREQIATVIASAKPYPELANSEDFKKAVYGLNLEKAERMILLAKRSVAYLAEEAKRKEHREQSKMGKLIEDAKALGISEADVLAMSACELREAIALEREWQLSLKTATSLGCYPVVKIIGRGKPKEVTVFLVQAKKLTNEARLYGVEVEVGNFIACGNLNVAEKMIAEKKGEIEFFAVKTNLQNRINSLPEPSRPPRQTLFAVLCDREFGTKGYKDALYQLEKSLKDCGA